MGQFCSSVFHLLPEGLFEESFELLVPPFRRGGANSFGPQVNGLVHNDNAFFAEVTESFRHTLRSIIITPYPLTCLEGIFEFPRA